MDGLRTLYAAQAADSRAAGLTAALGAAERRTADALAAAGRRGGALSAAEAREAELVRGRQDRGVVMRN